jgi:hypothetical protein
MQVARSTEGLREILFNEIESVTMNKSTPIRARAVSQCAMAICQTVELDLAYQRQAASTKATSIPAIPLVANPTPRRVRSK